MQLNGLSNEIWKKKYKHDDDHDINDTWMRVAEAVASVESDPDLWREEFYRLLENFRFIPGGRITAGAGTPNNFLLNCAVLPVEDSIDGIYETVKKSAVLAKSNYGVGFDFSDIRPENDILSKGGVSSGPVSFMKVFDASGSVIQTGGARRAAQIGILRVDHPDIFGFIDAKRHEGVLTQFNISVGLTNKFIEAVKTDALFELVFKGKVYRTVRAKEIWDKIVFSGYNYNDPGIFLIDEVNEFNNGYYMYQIAATNPCGEIPLPPYGVCDLGNLNLTQFVLIPFGKYNAWKDNFDWQGYARSVQVAVRFLDNVLTLSDYPFEEIRERANGDRRIGLCAVAGLGSFLAMMNIPYDSPEAIKIAEEIQEFATKTAYSASIQLAKEKGAFPNYDADNFMRASFVRRLGIDTMFRREFLSTGIRNLALMTIPPVGTGSILAGNISNGLEPIFSLEYNRKVRQPDGSNKMEPVEDYAWGLWKKVNVFHEDDVKQLGYPKYFKTARQIAPKSHVDMQATLQYWIDGSISKTANIPENFTEKEYEDLIWYAIEKGCKGFTTFREGTREGVLVEKHEGKKEVKEVIKQAEPKALPASRPRVLDGKTYKIKDNSGSIYVTLNYTEEEGKKSPCEIFMFSSNENQELYAALGKTLSAVMRRTDDIDFLIDDLKSIRASTEAGGYFTPEYGFVRSRPQHIGLILEEFKNTINVPTKLVEVITQETQSEYREKDYTECPSCHEMSYIEEGGCSKCLSCAYSTCG